MRPVLALTVAYLLGSIPFGFLLVRAKQGEDVRDSGSGGTGATNVSRRAGKLAGVVTLLLDALKGGVAVYLARYFLTSDFGVNWWVVGAAILVILGHIFPVWLGFRGGKGVATAVGVFLSLSALGVLFSGLVFVIVVWLGRYISLGSIVAVVAFPICIWLLSLFAGPVQHRTEILVVACIAGALIVFMHRSNIARIMSGTESKFF